MPSPFGEGQTDTPINHHPLGEVSHKHQKNTDLPQPSVFSLLFESHFSYKVTVSKATFMASAV
jgi:hypothetical protein